MSRGTRRLALAAVLASTMMLLAAAPVTAKGKPDKPPKPTTTTTTEAPAGAPSCYERVREMGASAWAYDPVDPGNMVYPYETQWTGSAYVQTGIPMCIDIDQVDHTGEVTWTVTWTGGATARPIKGIKLVFERGVHGDMYAEHVSTDVVGEWAVTIDPGGLEPLVLVAMPRAGDKWTAAPTFTVTPAP